MVMVTVTVSVSLSCGPMTMHVMWCGVLCSNASGEQVFTVVATEKTKHIVDMVSKQKQPKKSSKVVR